MNFTVTLDISEEAVAQAERAARRRHSTLSEVVRSYLLAIASEEAGEVAMGNRQSLTLPETAPLTLADKISAVKNSSGILPLPAGFDLKEFILKEKSKDDAGS